MIEYIKISEHDNVAVALKNLPINFVVKIDDAVITLVQDIPAGHKFALSTVTKGAEVVKYGHKIGFATSEIACGSHVHTHNIKTTLGDLDTYEYMPSTAPHLSSDEYVTFNGYKREGNKVGCRNDIWIIPTVGCVNGIAKELEKMTREICTDAIDGVYAFPHPYGCSQMGNDQENTKRILANLIQHPNAGGVLVVGLGCENSNIGELKKILGSYSEKRVKFFECQDYDDEIEIGFELIKELLQYTSAFTREKIPASKLIVGLKCGGSDGFSGITANPLVGVFSDLLIARGGTTILTEVPEMFGAETILMERCESKEVFDKTVALINDFKEYFKSHNQTIYENPSPGNKKGGISTLEDKSLGCTQKSGTATVTDVLNYGETVNKAGLNLLNSPGNDLVAATALAASGAHIVLFTTGRGTPFACPVPTMKISSNTPLANKKNTWIDFDCGRILDNEDKEKISNELFQFVIDVASGVKLKSELKGYHDIAIFKQGVTL